MVERELVERAKRGDREAFTTLAAAHIDRLYATATLILRDRSAAEDAVQETLFRVWRDLPTLRRVDRFRAWLDRIMANCCTDAFRGRRRRSVEIELLSHHEAGGGDSSSAVADRDALNRAFRRLSVNHRSALVLRHYLGLSVADVADRLSVPVGTAKSRLHHAERALRAALEADERPGSRRERA